MASERALRLPEILRCIFEWLLVVDQQSLRAAGKIDRRCFCNIIYCIFQGNNPRAKEFGWASVIDGQRAMVQHVQVVFDIGGLFGYPQQLKYDRIEKKNREEEKA